MRCRASFLVIRTTVSTIGVGAAPVEARERMGAAVSSGPELLARAGITATSGEGRAFLAT